MKNTSIIDNSVLLEILMDSGIEVSKLLDFYANDKISLIAIINYIGIYYPNMFSEIPLEKLKKDNLDLPIDSKKLIIYCMTQSIKNNYVLSEQIDYLLTHIDFSDIDTNYKIYLTMYKNNDFKHNAIQKNIYELNYSDIDFCYSFLKILIKRTIYGCDHVNQINYTISQILDKNIFKINKFIDFPKSIYFILNDNNKKRIHELQKQSSNKDFIQFPIFLEDVIKNISDNNYKYIYMDYEIFESSSPLFQDSIKLLLKIITDNNKDMLRKRYSSLNMDMKSLTGLTSKERYILIKFMKNTYEKEFDISLS